MLTTISLSENQKEIKNEQEKEITMVAERRPRKINNNKPYKKTIKESLKENPQPIKVPSNKQESMEVEPESENKNNNIEKENNNQTESLQHLDPSFINEPTIEKAKKNNKKERAKEIRELAKEIQLPSDKKAEKQNKENTTKVLKIAENQDNYNIVDDIGNKFANITIGQLLNINPKLRTELSKALKYTTVVEDKGTILSTIKKDKIVKTKCKVKNIETTVYLDSCSSINMITKKFMIENNIPFKPISTIKETLYQACNNTTLISKLYEIEITIGNITSKEIFRLVEKDDIFQVLIGVEALARMKLIMDFSEHILYQKTDEVREIGSFESVYELEEEEEDINDEIEEELNKNIDEICILTFFSNISPTSGPNGLKFRYVVALEQSFSMSIKSKRSGGNLQYLPSYRYFSSDYFY
ncbi:hypothetical protein BCR32DRAFT_285565 [Anaeromyces robustus]|uniref:Aspartic peptidase DDI1-type domain-containing protein n=1 Tax=Anaeromyces robustus TaxID=1754192 RepID=A0A1Y1WIX6_9FUNG|nr:hypothetical protein BCR32DRAFT_285565 [Anaeromyces robustus]|eukprot:ORX73531.1 hypothetical protein BCR32DRAFT_285565 [Anaeromyces robustus]